MQAHPPHPSDRGPTAANATRPPDDPLARLGLGARVWSADGWDVGAVSGRKPHEIRLGRRGSPHYWIPDSLIAVVEPRRILLTCDRSALPNHAPAQPRVARQQPAHSR